ncbi:MAG: pyridoxal-5'-phosphate-dependent protein subunit beta, partial [Myxococcota bacterium]|nr:pyridoxal-5'-phosphate-dependent protein subunit beta [Myxococcota bacterium]
MKGLGLSTEIVDHSMYQGTVKRFRERNIRLPTFAQLANPKLIPAKILERLRDVDPDAPDALNLFRVHWFNSRDRRELVDIPCHVVLGKELTGIDTPIVVS